MRLYVIASMLVLILVVPAPSWAEGILSRVPEDGAWAKFDIEGKGTGSDGKVQVTVKGTQTVRCVGVQEVDGEPCRWIEVDTDSRFERVGREAGSLHEIFKLLIAEKYLVEGMDPREGIRIAFQKQGDSPVKRLELQGADARQIESMDELFHAPFEPLRSLPIEKVVAAGKDWECRGVEGRRATDAENFSTVTRLHNDAPFGVVTYTYDKQRLRDGKQAGGRSMNWKLTEIGTGAVSALPDSR
jgi:hypothetical protein